MFIAIGLFFGVVAVILLLTSRLRSRKRRAGPVGRVRAAGGPDDRVRPALPRARRRSSSRSRTGSASELVGLDNYQTIFTDDDADPGPRQHRGLGAPGAHRSPPLIGLVYAVLIDRARFEKFAKALIFLPMAISLVGASIIWRFVYDYRDTSREQIGLANAILKFLGFDTYRFLQRGAVEHLLPDRDHDLGPGGLRDDHPRGLDQGDPRRHHRGGPPRRRRRPQDVPLHHDPEHPAVADRGAHHDQHHHAEGLRHRAHHDRRQLRHQRARLRVLRAELP